MSRGYQTVQGDTWDGIAHKTLGSTGYTDQLIRVEAGRAQVLMGSSEAQLNHRCQLGPGQGVFVPAGTWHNVRNTGCCPLRLSSVYAPAQHPRGTIHRTKADAEK